MYCSKKLKKGRSESGGGRGSIWERGGEGQSESGRGGRGSKESGGEGGGEGRKNNENRVSIYSIYLSCCPISLFSKSSSFKSLLYTISHLKGGCFLPCFFIQQQVPFVEQRSHYQRPCAAFTKNRKNSVKCTHVSMNSQQAISSHV